MISPTLPLNATKVHCGVDPGAGVGWTAGASAFLTSLNPEFVPVPTALGQVDPPVHSDASIWLQGTELAARVVSAYTSLPGGSGTLTSVLNFCIAAQTLWRLKGTNKEQDQKATPGQRLDNRPPSVPKTAIALGAVANLVVADAASDSSDRGWIEIGNVTTLSNIGSDPNYPLDGSYRQSANIDARQLRASIGNNSHPFTGQYDGRGKAIDNLRCCLVANLDGTVHSLRFRHADIVANKTAAVVACEVTHRGVVRGIEVEHARVFTNATGAHAGIGAGVASGTVDGINVINSTLDTSGLGANAAIGAGVLDNNGRVRHINALQCTVRARHFNSAIGIGAGKVARGDVSHTTAIDCLLETSGFFNDAGVGAGLLSWSGNSRVDHTLARRTTIKTHETLSDAGVGCGRMFTAGTAYNTTAEECRVETFANAANAAIGCGSVFKGGTVQLTEGTRCQVRTSGRIAHAAIGAGEIYKWASVIDTLSTNSTVDTSGNNAYAGIGVGYVVETATVTGTRSLNSKATATGYFSSGSDSVQPTGLLPAVTVTDKLLSGLTPTSATLPVGVMAGIAAGAAVFLAAGGLYAYHRYRRSTPPTLKDIEDPELA